MITWTDGQGSVFWGQTGSESPRKLSIKHNNTYDIIAYSRANQILEPCKCDKSMSLEK